MAEPTAFDKPYFVNLAISLLRHFLTGAGAWFVTNNIGSQGQWELLLAGLASLLVGAAMMVYSKYRTRVRFLTALTSEVGTTEKDVDKSIAAGDGVGQVRL